MGIDGGLEALAAEYVLGTLDPQERAQADARIADDPEFAALVESWQERLAPLAASIPPVTPSERLKDSLMARLDELSPPLQSSVSVQPRRPRSDTSSIERLRRQVVRWRIAAGVATVLASGFMALWLSTQGSDEVRFVAALEGEGSGGPAFMAVVDLDESVVYIKEIRAQPTGPNESYELWAVGGGRPKPQSLGVIGHFQQLPVNRVGDLTLSSLAETRFAVSREPSGGSPTGQPSGEIPYIGRLIAIKP
jgi:anti-sigma-K factor RskA